MVNEKSWDTVIVNKSLKTFVGNKFNYGDEYLQCVTYVLQQRLYCHNTDAAITKGNVYYPFEK